MTVGFTEPLHFEHKFRVLTLHYELSFGCFFLKFKHHLTSQLRAKIKLTLSKVQIPSTPCRSPSETTVGFVLDLL